MKTAVSLPDQLFRAGETEARRRRVSRSRLYAQALSELLAKQEKEEITRVLDRVYARRPSKLDPVLKALQTRAISKDHW